MITKTRGAWGSALCVAILAATLLELTGCGSSYTSSGILYYRQKNYAKAVEQLDLAVRANPNDYRAQYHLSICLAELKRWSDASEHFAKAKSIDPKKKDEVELQQEHYRVTNFNAGVDGMRNHNYAAAIDNFKAASDVWPERSEAYALLGASYEALASDKSTPDSLRDADYKKAVDYLTLAVTKDPKDADSWLDLGQTQLRLKNDAEAEKAYQSALDAVPADSTDKRMDVYIRLGDMDFLRAIGMPAADSLAKFAELDKAFAQYSQAAVLHPDDARTQYQLGLCRFNQMKYGEAAEYFSKAADLSEGRDQQIQEDALYNMGLAALNAEDGQRAMDAGDRLLQIKEDANYYLLRARGRRLTAQNLEKQGKKKEAEALTNQSLDDFKKANQLSGG